ncbi:tyrosine-type recombinase/integrase [Xenorhabdus bovienii]|uniref:tyrosine-type recombinase/integrase n=1 Tax=Xenorhabdus bovienii TaxID=40576 RepID=UPI0023B3269A|nr:integrase arm-type DNA-binding domain-containing protein [Xenorhabdus bovienii]MDE9467309.1 integrase arm-type DNA-binding domain-containing protein [Xenorhabdus bovienii]
MPLTDTKIKNAKPKDKPYSLPDGNGLYLEVRPTGAKFWRYRFWLTPTKDSRYTIGEYPYIGLADARKERDWAKEQVKKGHNPTDVKKKEKYLAELEKGNTFKAIALEWINKKEPNWSDGTTEQVKTFLDKNCYPAFGDNPIREVTAHDILKVLKSMEARGSASSALKIRQWCSAIFCYAVSTLRAEYDPAAALKGAIISPKTEHSRCLSYEEIKLYFERLEKTRVYSQTKLALGILPFVFVRQSELRKATWDEIDFDNKLWVIKSERMKMKRPHSVPLTDRMLDAFRKLEVLFGDNEQRLVFPGINTPSKPIGESTLNRAIEYMGFGSKYITCHDFRATASTTLYEMGFRREVIEKQLAHAEQNRSVAAYNHAEYLNERREMMEAWEKHLLSIASGITLS